MVLVVYLSGVCHPATTLGSDYHGFYFRASEFEDAAKKLHGQPVYLEHDKKDGPIGTIIKMVYRPNGDLAAHMIITDATKNGKLAIEGLRTGYYGALSIGQKVNDDVYHTGKCTRISPFEVSICAVPGRDGSHIERFGANGFMYQVTRFQSSQFQSSQLVEPRTHHNKMDTASRIATADTGSSGVVNASGQLFNQLLKETGYSEEYIVTAVRKLDAEAKQNKKAKIDELYQAINGKLPHVRRADMDSLEDLSLEVLASMDGNFKEAEKRRLAREAELANEIVAANTKIKELEHTNQSLQSKLGEHAAAPALTHQEERFQADTTTDVNASGGYHFTAGAVPEKKPTSCFTNPLYKPKGNPFGDIAKRVKVMGFDRGHVTDTELLD
jgi:hypothetical protein